MVQNLATCWEIRALDVFQEISAPQVILTYRRSTCAHNLAEVVRWERATHADRYSGGAVEQQIRNGGREHVRFFTYRVVRGPKICGAPINVPEKHSGKGAQSRFGVAHRGR